jgi:hypothetical protein
VGSYEEPNQVESKVCWLVDNWSWISSSDPTTEEEVTCPMGQDRAKAVAWKGKRKGEGRLSKQNESSSAMGDMMSTMKKLSYLFAKVKLWK